MLGGCAAAALPPALAAASYAADGASMVVSGKSVTDHAISGMADQDCAMLRLVRLERPCRAYAEEEVATTSNPAVEVAEPGPVEPAFEQPTQPAVGDLVLGSFAYRANAETLADRHADLGARVVLARIDGRTYHRVLVPVHNAETARILRHRLAAESGGPADRFPALQTETASAGND